MYDERLEQLIDAALTDGELTEKEKQILFKKAESLGIDLDEFEMVLDARLHKSRKDKPVQTEVSAPKSDKFGDIRKCPACGAILQSFQTTCTDCGYEFKNVQAVQSAQKLFNQLQSVELRKTEKISQHEIEKTRRLDELSRRHNSDSSLVKVLGGKKRHEIQDEEREDLIRELNRHLDVIEKDALSEKRNIIRNFPVPNSKEDLMELLAMATSNAYDNDGVIGPEEEVWIQKTDQIYQKIVVCAATDKSLLIQATNMIVSLIKRLPKKYKKFTQIPQEMMPKVQEDLQREKDAKKEEMLKLAKKWGIPGGVCLLVAIIMLILGCSVGGGIWWLIFLIAIIGLYVIYKLFMKDYKQTKELF